uniref:Uncharacterized protein n=1 Tax=Hyaloperonospora arabidopsidis (strain Emoy2) TaxID=559515 RepID=M4BFX7_HYAAE
MSMCWTCTRTSTRCIRRKVLAKRSLWTDCTSRNRAIRKWASCWESPSTACLETTNWRDLPSGSCRTGKIWSLASERSRSDWAGMRLESLGGDDSLRLTLSFKQLLVLVARM